MVLIMAVMMVVFVGLLGLAIDMGYAYLQRTRLQQVADSEALACAISPASSPCPRSGGDVYPAVNAYNFNISINNPGDESLCQTANQQNCVSATAQTTWNTFFINLFGVSSINLSATGVAGRQDVLPSCIITTASFSANGNNQVALNNCAASIGGTLSTTNKAGIDITGAGKITVFNGNSPNQCGSCTPTPVGDPGPIPDLPNPAIPTKNINGATLATLPYTLCTNSSCVPAIYTGGVVTLNAATVLQSG